jgi:hypothetical protein
MIFSSGGSSNKQLTKKVEKVAGTTCFLLAAKECVQIASY